MTSITNSREFDPFLLSTYDYLLPPELVAQTPLPDRLDSRMLVVRRKESVIRHSQFRSLHQLLKPNDLLIFNDTRVIPARLFGQRPSGGKVEVLLLEKLPSGHWKSLVRPARRNKPGDTLLFDGTRGYVTDAGEEGEREIRFEPDLTSEILRRIGNIPLPPYIHETLSDEERYQTIYARKEGAVAAPTAGLHFTGDFLEELKRKGVQAAYVTLHVGAGTFKPVSVEDIRRHPMHEERYSIPKETVAAVNEARSKGGRVIAVGTTSARTLETALISSGENFPEKDYRGRTDIFIYPGYRFKALDGLLTNFHLPKSTLLMMVSAFGGMELINTAYQEAVRERYRFFSFGDAMLILDE